MLFKFEPFSIRTTKTRTDLTFKVVVSEVDCIEYIENRICGVPQFVLVNDTGLAQAEDIEAPTEQEIQQRHAIL